MPRKIKQDFGLAKEMSELTDNSTTRHPRISFHDVERATVPFTGDDTYPLQTWLEEFEEMAILMEWTDVEELIYAKRLLQGTARLFLRSLGPVKSFMELKKALIDEFGPRVNSATIHQQLASKKMTGDLSIQQYFLQMKELALNGKVEDAALMEYVINGLRGEPASKAVLYGATDIADFRKKLDIFEKISSSQSRAGASHTRAGPSQDRAGAYHPRAGPSNTRTGPNHPRGEPSYRRPVRRCYACGESDHDAVNCRYKQRGAKCFKCNEFGHIAPNCSAERRALNVNEKENSLKRTSIPQKEIKVNDTIMMAHIDTGSDINLITEDNFKKLNIKSEPIMTQLTGLGQHQVRTKGLFLAELEIDDCRVKMNFHIIENDAVPFGILLGNGLLHFVELKITKDGVMASEASQLCLLGIGEDNQIDVGDKFKGEVTKLIDNYTPVETKKSPVVLKIILTEETPIYQNPRRLSPFELKVVEDQIKMWDQEEVIQPSNSDFASPIVLAKKKNGSYRLCVDYRRLNKKIIKERFPLPLIEDQLDKLRDAELYTTLDLKNGFHHVPVDKDSQKYTSFVTPTGQYEFCKMPFGLSTAPSVFQRFINSVFKDLLLDGTVLSFLDDLNIPAKTEEEAINRLEVVLKRAEEYGLIINWQKCQFMKRQIEYLGYIITDNTVQPSPLKIQAVMRFKEPKNVKGVQSFLGLTGYFRKFIPNYSITARPLTELLKKDKEFVFDDTCQTAFDTLKRHLCNSPVLQIYNPNAETELHTDASMDGYGAVLLQKSLKDDKMHPVYYTSKKTTEAERKYHSYYLEVMAIAEAVKKFRVYLLGIPFKIVTDCSALTMTLQKKDLPPRVARWALMLEEYSYKIEHRPGSSMKHVDALSRYPVTLVVTEITEKVQKAQQEDKRLQLIMKILEKEEYEDYAMRNGVLYKDGEEGQILVVPKKMQTEIIRKQHERGHFGVKKTEELIKREFYIDNLQEKIRTHIANCVECILASRKTGKKEGFLNPIDKGDQPLHTYHIDHVGPMTATQKNYKYILTVVDAFTKFVWIYPTKTLKTDEVLQKLRSQAEVFGSPQQIISDRGAAFTSQEFEQYCQDEGITHKKITTGQPRGNGQAERMNQIIISVLSKLSLDRQDQWYKLVPQVQKHINSTHQRSTGRTPFELLIGVRMRTKEDQELVRCLREEMVQEFESKRNEIREAAKQQIQKVQIENRRTYNKKRKEASTYKVGDIVAIQRTQFGSHKLDPKFLGPYEVVEVRPKDRYAVQKLHGEGPYLTTTSCDMMKRYCCDDDDDDDDELGSPEACEIQEGRVG